MDYVLVVDDSIDQRKILSVIIGQIGFACVTACDGIEALGLIETNPPSLVILDVEMPGMNGYEVCHKLKSQPKTRNIPIMMCTGKSRDCDPYWGTKAGADAYLRKPFRITELIGIVEQVLPNKAILR
jgi:twitching motility two-component system response regulator PilH